MSHPYLIEPSREGEGARCAVRPLAGGFGFCQGGAPSCAACPRSKLDPHSPTRIEERDTVLTAAGELATVEGFEVRRGLQTGFVWIRTGRGLARLTISAVTLSAKRRECRARA
jgi:hypothetical protein